MALMDIAIEVKAGKKKLSDLPHKLRPAVTRIMSTLTPDQIAGYKRQQLIPRGSNGFQPHVRRARSV